MIFRRVELTQIAKLLVAVNSLIQLSAPAGGEQILRSGDREMPQQKQHGKKVKFFS